jgi:DNA-binding NarL/FixJ family response regulator
VTSTGHNGAAKLPVTATADWHDGLMDGASPTRDIGVAVVDDHPLVATALDGATGNAGGTPFRLVVRGTATNLAAALALLARDDLDVLVCDLQLDSGAEGLTVVSSAHSRGLPVLVVSGFERAAFARAAFERGAAGFLAKGEPVETIVAAIGRVADGGSAYGPGTIDALLAEQGQPTARELEVIRGIAAGRSTDEIASELQVSARTVESHVRRLFDRFAVVSRAELAIVAERQGWLSLPR